MAAEIRAAISAGIRVFRNRAVLTATCVEGGATILPAEGLRPAGFESRRSSRVRVRCEDIVHRVFHARLLKRRRGGVRGRLIGGIGREIAVLDADIARRSRKRALSVSCVAIAMSP